MIGLAKNYNLELHKPLKHSNSRILGVKGNVETEINYLISECSQYARENEGAVKDR